MPELTETHLLILSNAAQRDDHAVEVQASRRRAAGKRAIGQLIKRALLDETAAAAGMPVWRHDEALGSVSLVITQAGLDAIGIAPEVPDAADQDPEQAATPDEQNGAKRRVGNIPEPVRVAAEPPKIPRDGTKLSIVIALLKRPGGASIANLTEATGWLPHTMRAALTGLRKRGYPISTERGKDGTNYRLRAQPADEPNGTSASELTGA